MLSISVQCLRVFSPVERGFSDVINLLTNKRSQLDITERGDWRLSLTNLKTNTN